MTANGGNIPEIHKAVTQFKNATATDRGTIQTHTDTNAQLQQQLQAMSEYNEML